MTRAGWTISPTHDMMVVIGVAANSIVLDTKIATHEEAAY